MSRTFVVPDIHGRLDLLCEALRVIERRSPEGGKVVFLGDYVDRGPESREVVATLVAGPLTPGWSWEFLRGNHEDMMMQCISGHEIEWWISNGGSATLATYQGKDAELLEHLEWMAGLPTVLWDEHRVYVHAGVAEQHELTEQPETMTQWYRYPKRADVGYRGKHVVHGHEINMYGPELYPNRTALDTGAVHTGIMAVAEFDDAIPGGPTNILTIDLTFI